MKRPSFLAHHLRSFNRSLKPRYPRKWLVLYSIAVTVLALDLGWLHYQTHQNASTGVSVRSTATPATSHAIRDEQESVKLLWRQESQSGIEFKEPLSFTF